MTRLLSWVLAFALSGVALPAAANWVTLDYQLGRGGQWLDRDTVRRDGDLVYFEASARFGNRVYPDDRTAGIAQAYDCRTKTLHRLRDGALDRGPDARRPRRHPLRSHLLPPDLSKRARRGRLISAARASICALIPHAGPSYRCPPS